MYNVKTLNKIAACGTDLLDRSKYTVGDDIDNPQAILVRSASMHEMELGDDLLAIARAGAGVNNIPVDKCSEKGIVVFNTPGANANAVKELVILGLLISSRKVTAAIDWAKTLKGKGDEVGKLVEKGKSQFVGPEIKGKKLGVIGLGAIGALVANAAAELGMEVIGADPFLSVQGALNLSNKVKYVKSNKEIFETCDYITVHVPLTPETKDMINADVIKTMKKNVRIMNFARGGLVNNADIKAALKSGKVGKYVVDFPDAETVNCEGIVAIPHLGASTEESEDNCAVMAVDEIKDYLENGNILHSVNLPDCSLPLSEGGRIAVIHKNIPNVIAKFTEALASVNISGMINKSKGDIAYSLINTDHEIPKDAAEKLSAMDSVIALRIIK